MDAVNIIAITVASINSFCLICIAVFNHISKQNIERSVKELEKELEKQNIKQSVYIQKTHILIESAIEVLVRMMFNKLLLSYYPKDNQSRTNLFLLQKNAMVIEANLVIYAPPEITDAISDFKAYILSVPEAEFQHKWGEIYNKGSSYLMKCRAVLGIAIDEKFQDFVGKLKTPPEQVDGVVASTNSLGEITFSKIQNLDGKQSKP